MYLFPEMKMMGCWFHYKQAIRKKHQILGLGKLYKTGEIYADWLRKLMALPLSPRSEITSTFSVLEAQIFELCGTDKVLVDKFKKYIKKTWILGEKDLSVYSSQIATNNGCESFHKTLKSSIKVHHPNVWKFLTELSKIITDFASEYMRLENDLQITRLTKRNVIEKTKRRKEYKEKLENGTFSAEQYLNAASLTIGRKGKSIPAEYSQYTVEMDDMYSDEEESSLNDCIISCQTKEGSFALVPCGHANLCNDCGHHFLNEENACPICRTPKIRLCRYLFPIPLFGMYTITDLYFHTFAFSFHLCIFYLFSHYFFYHIVVFIQANKYIL